MIYLKTFLQTIRWLLLAPINLLFFFVAFVLFNWWLPFLAVAIKPGDYLWDMNESTSWRGLQRLPEWLYWFDTFDASIDAGWVDGYFSTAYHYTVANPPPYWTRKWYQFRWLARNTSYGFAWGPVGIVFRPSTWTVVRNDGIWFIARSTDGFWQIGYGGRLGSYNLGWKAQEYFGNSGWNQFPWGPKWRTQIVLSANPFKRG